MTQPAIPYHSYLLRFWCEHHENGQIVWRYTLLDPHTGQRFGFLSLDSLVAYLAALTSESTLPDNTDTPSPTC